MYDRHTICHDDHTHKQFYADKFLSRRDSNPRPYACGPPATTTAPDIPLTSFGSVLVKPQIVTLIFGFQIMSESPEPTYNPSSRGTYSRRGGFTVHVMKETQDVSIIFTYITNFAVF